MTKSQIISLAVSITVGAFFYFLVQIPIPILIYEYDSNNMGIIIWNVGLRQATGITVTIDPTDKLNIQSVHHSRLSGEPVINYTSSENGIVYYIPHMYVKDKIIFYLTNVDSKPLPDKIDIIVRANEGEGIEATNFFVSLLEYLQIILVLVALFLACGIYLVLSKYLTSYVKRNT